ncbi:UNKNOWN [Stylonychia lemnae]|uniref:Uncharacterized protein n=1 Tax=Stylonychia lemnae TaxID=5949 RepID=A0A078ADM8_STYLE|nr:UNKNOWN [Stylonychia lemnae]|eukprot:CDW78988.1 UNKNOWN [Stylonychia lemnae]
MIIVEMKSYSVKSEYHCPQQWLFKWEQFELWIKETLRYKANDSDKQNTQSIKSCMTLQLLKITQIAEIGKKMKFYNDQGVKRIDPMILRDLQMRETTYQDLNNTNYQQTLSSKIQDSSMLPQEEGNQINQTSDLQNFNNILSVSRLNSGTSYRLNSNNIYGNQNEIGSAQNYYSQVKMALNQSNSNISNDNGNKGLLNMTKKSHKRMGNYSTLDQGLTNTLLNNHAEMIIPVKLKKIPFEAAFVNTDLYAEQ